ncbi:MAG: hypothetical protein AB1631_20015 [Acidobacteriota bacterium]
MKRLPIIALLFFALAASQMWNGSAAQSIRVNPDGVNVNASGSTVVFLTFGPLVGRVPAEGCWCGELMAASPGVGLKCNPATIFGCLPARQDFSTPSGNSAFTDIMSIPPSVARRAYQAAQNGATSSFFYVRRFVSLTGGPDEFVAVTCRMSGGGARTPFALTDVKLSFSNDKPVALIRSGERLPTIKAEITYNGTGRLRGRWEVVLPGDERPSVRDLLTEASLPAEERAMQRRYTQLSRFNVFLPPGTKYTLEGPDPSRLPITVEGQYLILLRIEATDDKEGDSNLSVVGGAGVIHSGAVAGFPLPPLGYMVGSGTDASEAVRLLLPVENAVRSPSAPVDFSWTETPQAAFYRIEIETAQGQSVMSAILPPGNGIYRAPPWLSEKSADGNLRWRVVALDQTGNPIAETAWRNLQIKPVR